MKTAVFPLGLVALALAACSPAPPPAHQAVPGAPAAQAVDAPAEDIVIASPWIRQPPPSASVAGGYLQIDNHGPEADRLLAVETDAAGRVEIHAMDEVDGVMRMRELQGGLEVPAAGRVALEPGGYHLMLMEPRAGLEVGAQVDATLVFERAGRVEIAFEVRPLGETGSHDGHGERHGSGHGH